MSTYPADLRYSKDHEWIRVEGESCTMGITHFAQDELGEVVFVDLPDPGESFDTREEIGTIESVKAVAEVYTPIAGEVLAINEALADNPEAVNEDPHGRGWLVKLKIAEPGQLDGLLSAEQYEEFLAAS